MSLYRLGQLSTFNPESSQLDNFVIKTPVTSLNTTSIELADHFNHYFDAVIKTEELLPSYLGTNIKSFLPVSSWLTKTINLIPENQISISKISSGYSLTSNGQEFDLTVPTSFGTDPFKDPSFSISIQIADTESGVEGVYSNKNPLSYSVWNTLSKKNTLFYALKPPSSLAGSSYKIKIMSIGTGLNPGDLVNLYELLNDIDISGSYEAYFGNSVLGGSPLAAQVYPLNQTKYKLQSFVVSGSDVDSSNRQHPFVICTDWKDFLNYGYGFNSSTSNFIVGLSSFSTSHYYDTNTSSYVKESKSRAGLLKLNQFFNNDINLLDQYTQFRVCGFQANSTFYNKPFSCVGPAVRISGEATSANFYGLVMGDALGTVTSSGTPLLDNAPITVYLAKFNNFDLSKSLSEDTRLIDNNVTLPRAGNLTGITILSNPIVLSYTNGVDSNTYRLTASGNVISLQGASSGSVFSSIYNAIDTTPLTEGVPGFFSIARQLNQDITFNPSRWLFLDGLKYGSLTPGPAINFNINAFYLKTGVASNFIPKLSFEGSDFSSVPLSGYVWSWSTANSFYSGNQVTPNLPWEFNSNTKPFLDKGNLVLKMNYDPTGYRDLDFSCLMRNNSVDLSSGDWVVSFRISMLGGNYLSTTIDSNSFTNYEFGVSSSASGVIKTLNYIPDQIQYKKVPLSQIRFSSYGGDRNRPRSADFTIPLDNFNTSILSNLKTIYIKGEIVSDGSDGVKISDIQFTPIT
jgi:hypothetical protein